MNIYTYLKNDHHEIKNLFEQVLATKEFKQRSHYFEKLCKLLLTHSKAEEKTFYKALKRDDEVQEEVTHGEEEHQECQDYIKKLSKLNINSEEWIEQFGEFKHAVYHHINEEEAEIFQDAHDILTKIEEKTLVEDMKEAKNKVKI